MGFLEMKFMKGQRTLQYNRKYVFRDGVGVQWHSACTQPQVSCTALKIFLKERREIKIYLVFVLVSWHRALNALGIYNLLCAPEMTPE